MMSSVSEQTFSLYIRVYFIRYFRGERQERMKEMSASLMVSGVQELDGCSYCEAYYTAQSLIILHSSDP